MKLLIADINTETQAFCAKRIEAFGQGDAETLDLKVKLVSERDALDRVKEADVLVLGSGLGEAGITLARQSLTIAPWVHVIMFVTEEFYGGGAFRAAHAVGVRKVFPDSASPLDFLQELVAIHSDFRKEGRTPDGRVIAVTHAKGGVGATSISAALGEVSSMHGRKTLLWDLDVETRDLSRSLAVNGIEAKVVSSWVNGTREISRDSLKDALFPISPEASVLMPPDRMAESIDLVCHIDGMAIAQRILQLSRVLFDVVIVDTAGRMGPATGGILRDADVVLIVIDDTILGLTAMDYYLTYVKNLVGSTDRILFLVNPYSGAMVDVSQIAAELEPIHNLGEIPWSLPSVPNDPKASRWPGTGHTLFSYGQKSTRAVFLEIAQALGILGEKAKKTGTLGTQGTISEALPSAGGGFLNRILGR